METSSSEGEGDYLMPWSRVLNWNRLPSELSLSPSLCCRPSPSFSRFLSFPWPIYRPLFALRRQPALSSVPAIADSRWQRRVPAIVSPTAAPSEGVEKLPPRMLRDRTDSGVFHGCGMERSAGRVTSCSYQAEGIRPGSSSKLSLIPG